MALRVCAIVLVDIASNKSVRAAYAVVRLRVDAIVDRGAEDSPKQGGRRA